MFRNKGRQNWHVAEANLHVGYLQAIFVLKSDIYRVKQRKIRIFYRAAVKDCEFHYNSVNSNYCLQNFTTIIQSFNFVPLNTTFCRCLIIFTDE